jgi:predicted dehydrogenase
VNVMHHREIALTAIDAGKVVYCEWPLGRNLGEARELAAAARAEAVRTVVGLQGRAGPAVRYVRDLVADGYLGKPLGTVIKAGAPHAVWAGVLDEPQTS